jgi:hypothetical protein
LTVACYVFSEQAVLAVVGTVLALPGIPLHLVSQVAKAIAQQTFRTEGEVESNALLSQRELASAAVCLAPFLFEMCPTNTGMSIISKFPRLRQSFTQHFRISPQKWEELLQTASRSLLSIADPASDGTFVGLAAAGSWLCESLLMVMLTTGSVDTACEIAASALKWHAVQKRLGSLQSIALVKRCCTAVEHRLLSEGPETFRLRCLRSALDELRCIFEATKLDALDCKAVGILEKLVIQMWLSAKPVVSVVNVVTAALRRIIALQERTLRVFKNSANTLKSSAPGCVWRLLQRANAAEWLSHVGFAVRLCIVTCQ